uniref:Phosphoprotein n=1 Tax=Echinostoma caproni TaxID=27848 RepID=A0A183A3E4_9TREM
LASHALLGRSSKKRSREADGGQTEDSSQVSADASSSITSASVDRSGLFGPDDSADEYSTASSESDTEEYAKLRENINPVTGRWELPRPNPMEGMSEEQKEYTAIELVNQIDRLQR